MAEQITIPISIFELTTRYEKPAIRLLGDRLAFVQALFDAFAEFGPTADDLEPITNGKTSEQGIKLRLPSEKITFFAGAAFCKFTKEDAYWQDADKVLGILDTFLKILTEMADVSLGNKTSILSLHIQPKIASYRDILRPFVDERIRSLDKEPLKAMAIIARWPGRRITLDGSAQLANGIFLQMEREFPGSMSMDDAKERIYNDEVAVLKLLNVEEIEE